MNEKVCVMTMDDYDEVYALWSGIKGFGMRSIDDSRENIARFIKRNPTTSMVAKDEDGHVIGAILCGHDGRRACFYHVCVKEEFRKRGIAKELVEACIKALKEEQINKVTIVAFKTNENGNRFWKSLGWELRDDLNSYDFSLNDENVTIFNK